ncbi:MAG: conserved rane protein of unknown function [Bryobacterales bacterium]|nr:conserved rane protein of unknown function [Bryobacterales bacterium]
MAEREGSPFTIPTAVLLLAGAAIGWSRYVRPLQSERPTGTAGYSQKATGEQHLLARLWQDPFEVAAGYHQAQEQGKGSEGGERTAEASRGAPYDVPASPAKPATSDEFDKLVKRIEKEGKEGRILIMPVMASNAPYPDDAEWRRRARYAVLSALSTAGFVPKDRSHLGCFDIVWPNDDNVQDGLESLRRLFAPAEPAPSKISRWVFTIGSSKVASNTRPEKSGTSNRLCIPYEWFSSDLVFSPKSAFQYDQVLVLWLDDDMFQVKPLTRMGYILWSLLSGHDFSDRGVKPLDVRVIGPDSSNTLTELKEDGLNDLFSAPPSQGTHSSGGMQAAGQIKESAYPTSGQIGGLFKRVKYYAPRATAANYLLRKHAGTPLSGHGGIESAAAMPPQEELLALTRTIGTDDQLLCMIVEELRRRDIDLKNADNHVALVTESDTFYGRATAATFKAALAAHRGGRAAISDKSDWEQAMKPEERPRDSSYREPQVRVFSYLRGLDGVTGMEGGAGDSRTRAAAAIAAAAAASGKELPADKPEAQPERPDGTRQFDYMRRITDELREWDRSLWYSDQGGIRAIGVLGSDVYDKLLVLRALHDAFPHARFFTTDLDNRLLQERELDSTRNLLIASGYGLRLSDGLQGNIPPFRDGYQTAVYASCLAALHNKCPAVVPEPRLYEVGRDGAYDISAGVRDRAWDNPLEIKELARVLFIAGCMLVAGLVLALPASRYLRRLASRSLSSDAAGAAPGEKAVTEAMERFDAGGKRETADVRFTWLGFLMLLVLFLGLVRSSFDNGNGKLWILAGGVSLWPTEVLRLIAAFLSVLFLIHAYYALYRGKVSAAARYGLKFPRQRAAFWKEVRDWIRPPYWRPGWRDRLFWKDMFTWEREQERNRVAAACAAPAYSATQRAAGHRVPALWDRYTGYAALASRLGRIVPLTILFVVLGSAALHYYGPPLRPIRGTFSDRADQFIFTASLFMMALMTFFVADATRLCEIFCRGLAGDQTPWRRSIVKRFVGERGMRKSDYMHARARWRDDQMWPDGQKWPDVQKWLDIQFIADHTQAIGQLIVYPFIVLAVMIVAHNPVFDRWEWPVPLILIFGVTCAYAVWCVIVLRRTAEGARRDAVEKLRQRLVQLSAETDPQAAARAAQIKITIEEIEGIRRGAFTPLSQHPLVGAVLIPISGAGALVLIQLLAVQR